MQRLLESAVSIVVTIALSGCAGTPFVRPDPATLTLGKTTITEVRQRFNVLFKEQTSTMNDQTVTSLSHVYADVAGTALESVTSTPTRMMAFDFFEGILVAHVFASSFLQDHTNFDEKKRPQIVKGKSTRAEVTQLVGRPAGSAIYPVIKQTTGDAALYRYDSFRGSAFNIRGLRKLLIVQFDANGVVTEVEFISSE